jgi:hypothetical protein
MQATVQPMAATRQVPHPLIEGAFAKSEGTEIVLSRSSSDNLRTSHSGGLPRSTPQKAPRSVNDPGAHGLGSLEP